MVLRRGEGETIPVLAVVARTDDVSERIALVREALALEPERVGPGALTLAGLLSVTPELGAESPVALFDLEEGRSEVLILDRGEPIFARTLSRGIAGLPESAAPLAREFRQTMAAYRASGGEPPTVGYLVGTGSVAPGAREFFAGELNIPIEALPAPRIELVNPEP